MRGLLISAAGLLLAATVNAYPAEEKAAVLRRDGQQCHWDGSSYDPGQQVDCYQGKPHCQYQHCICQNNGQWGQCWNDNNGNGGDSGSCCGGNCCNGQCCDNGQGNDNHNDNSCCGGNCCNGQCCNHNPSGCKWNGQWYDPGYECQSQDHCYQGYDYCKCSSSYKWECYNYCYWHNTPYEPGYTCDDPHNCYKGYDHCQCGYNGKWQCYNDLYCTWNGQQYPVGETCDTENGCYNGYDYCVCKKYGNKAKWSCQSNYSPCEWDGDSYESGTKCNHCGDGSQTCKCKDGQWSNCH